MILKNGYDVIKDPETPSKYIIGLNLHSYPEA